MFSLSLSFGIPASVTVAELALSDVRATGSAGFTTTVAGSEGSSPSYKQSVNFNDKYSFGWMGEDNLPVLSSQR